MSNVTLLQRVKDLETAVADLYARAQAANDRIAKILEQQASQTVQRPTLRLRKPQVHEDI